MELLGTGGRVEALREAERRVPPAARGALLVRAPVRGPRAAFCLGGSGCVRRVVGILSVFSFT